MSVKGTAPLRAGAAITTAASPTIGMINRYNALSAALAPTLPALSGLSAGASMGIEKDILDVNGHTVTFTCAGADTFDSGVTTEVLAVAGQLRMLQVVQIGGTKYWKVVTGNTPLGQLDDRYNLRGDVYNWNATNTRRLQRSLGKAIAGAGFSSHLIIGDSESASWTGSATFDKMWPRIMQNLLSARGLPIGGTGWVYTADNPIAGSDPRWTYNPAQWTLNPPPWGFLYTTNNGVALTFTSDQPGTNVSVAYFNNIAGTFTVAVDGGTPDAVTPAGGDTMSIYSKTGLANTVHTVVITTTSTSVCGIAAANVYGSYGLVVHNAALSGSQAAGDWVDASFSARVMNAYTLVPDPDVLHIQLGVNDLNTGGRTISAVIAAVTAIRQSRPNADAILYGSYQPSAVATWGNYIQALYALAKTLNCPLVDLYKRSGGYAVADANGLYAADDLHPNTIAQADQGQLVAGLLTNSLGA